MKFQYVTHHGSNLKSSVTFISSFASSSVGYSVCLVVFSCNPFTPSNSFPDFVFSTFIGISSNRVVFTIASPTNDLYFYLHILLKLTLINESLSNFTNISNIPIECTFYLLGMDHLFPCVCTKEWRNSPYPHC